jgi:D-3-phosphoglycerate dehydrogenase
MTDLPATSFPKSEIKVLLLENIHPSAKELFDAEGFQVDLLPKALPEDELIERVRDAHILGIRSKTRVTPRCGMPTPEACRSSTRRSRIPAASPRW